MSGCSTNWGAYLTSLKTGAESGAFARLPGRRDQPLGLTEACGSAALLPTTESTSQGGS